MPHVVTQACCGDASCVFACPVNCIHPTPDEPGFATAEMLYIDPDSCVDCGACVKACPVGAIVADTRLGEHDLPFLDINAAFHAEPPARPRALQAPVPAVVRLEPGRRLRVAIVGAGPAALYAADELLKQDGVEVTVLDRLRTPHGLVRAGVAPDHQETKSIERLFRHVEDQPGFEYRLGVQVGRDVSPAELAAHHDAVVHATGAPADRRLGIAGEDLPGSVTATDVVAWYNGHPDRADLDVDLSGERAVVVGNGNVALDVARILATDPERLAGTDIADHALAALRRSRVREIVVLGRRGPAQAAFTLPELTGLLARDDIDVVLDHPGPLPEADAASPAQRLKLQAIASIASRPRSSSRRRIVLRFLAAPQEIVGGERAEGVLVARTRLETAADGRVVAVPTDEQELLEASIVLRSVGYRSVAVPGVPFDDVACRVPNDSGRVLGPDGSPLPGTYVVGWAKRGPTGFIGTNKSCSLETVNALLTDARAGRLPTPTADGRALDALLRHRLGEVVGLADWRVLDAEERRRGRAQGRPRVKIVDAEEAARVARDRRTRRRRPLRRRSA